MKRRAVLPVIALASIGALSALSVSWCSKMGGNKFVGYWAPEGHKYLALQIKSLSDGNYEIQAIVDRAFGYTFNRFPAKYKDGAMFIDFDGWERKFVMTDKSDEMLFGSTVYKRIDEEEWNRRVEFYNTKLKNISTFPKF